MNQDEIKNSEAYWTKAVADFMKLGLKEAAVPRTSLDEDTAKAIAAKLKAHLEVRGPDYIFHQDVVDKVIEADEPHTQLEENFSHFENNNGNF